MQYVPATQPETTTEVLKRSLRVYRLTFAKVFFVSLAVSIVTFSSRLVALVTGTDVFAFLPAWSPLRLWLLLIYLVTLTLLMAILWRLQSVTTNSNESLKQDFHKAYKKFPLVLAAVIIQSIIFRTISLAAFGFNMIIYQQHLNYHTNYFALLLVFLPFLAEIMISGYLTMLFFFYFPLILTENKGPIDSLIRSAQLVWGYWWKTLWVQTLPWLCYLGVLLLMQSMGISTHIYFFKPTLITPLATAVHIFIFALFFPWFAATMLVQLRDLELRAKLNKKPRKSRVKKNPLPSV